MGTGRMYVSLSGEEFKKDKKIYEQKAKDEFSSTEKGDMLIDWKNAEVDGFEVDKNELTIDISCRDVFVSVTVPLPFEAKIKIAKELREEMKALKELGLLG